MRHPLHFLPPLAAWLALAAPLGARIWADTTGRTLDAEIIEVSEANVSLRQADGKIAVVPIDSLSIADRNFLHTARTRALAHAAMPAAIPTFAQMNELFGVPLFAEKDFWGETDVVVAQRLQLAADGFTGNFVVRYFESGIMSLGRPADLIKLQAYAKHPAEIDIVWGAKPLAAPKGSAAFVRTYDLKLKADFDAIAQLLTANLGPPRIEYPSETAANSIEGLIWIWRGQALRLRHMPSDSVSLLVWPANQDAVRSHTQYMYHM